jgi:phage-related protein
MGCGASSAAPGEQKVDTLGKFKFPEPKLESTGLGAFDTCFEKFKPPAKKIAEMGADILASLTSIMALKGNDKFSGFLGGASTIEEILSGLIKKAKEIFNFNFNIKEFSLVTSVKEGAESAAEGMKEALTGFLDILKAVVLKIKEVVMNAVPKILETLKPLVAEVKSLPGKALGEAKKAGMGMKEAMDAGKKVKANSGACLKTFANAGSLAKASTSIASTIKGAAAA